MISGWLIVWLNAQRHKGKIMIKKEKAAQQNGTTPNTENNGNTDHGAPIVSGQHAEVLNILRRGPVLSLELSGMGIICYGARVHELRAKGFNIETVIQPIVYHNGREHRDVARYALKQPEWAAPEADE